MKADQSLKVKGIWWEKKKKEHSDKYTLIFRAKSCPQFEGFCTKIGNVCVYLTLGILFSVSRNQEVNCKLANTALLSLGSSGKSGLA